MRSRLNYSPGQQVVNPTLVSASLNSMVTIALHTPKCMDHTLTILSVPSPLHFSFFVSIIFGLSPPPKSPRTPSAPPVLFVPPSSLARYCRHLYCAPSSSSDAEISRAEARATRRRRRPLCVQSSPRAGCESAAQVPRCKPTASTAEPTGSRWQEPRWGLCGEPSCDSSAARQLSGSVARQLVPARGAWRLSDLVHETKACAFPLSASPQALHLSVRAALRPRSRQTTAESASSLPGACAGFGTICWTGDSSKSKMRVLLHLMVS